MEISFEFFPPKTLEGADKLRIARAELEQAKPKFFSVTYGAGGSTQDGTLATVKEIIASGTEAAPHLSCIGANRSNMAQLLEQFKADGIKRIVALRGDLPSGMLEIGDFRYAYELVQFIREHSGDYFWLEVAAYPEMHPQAKNPQADLDAFIQKVRSGANSAITQYFYNAEAYFQFVEQVRGRGVDTPVIPGIMPMTNYSQLARFSDACGAEIPRWIRLKLQSYGDDRESIRAFGQEVVVSMCEKLIAAKVQGLHFYTMNTSGPTLGILKALGLF
jgi:methylenetetrahydrofolate reductase (NADPH)